MFQNTSVARWPEMKSSEHILAKSGPGIVFTRLLESMTVRSLVGSLKSSAPSCAHLLRWITFCKHNSSRFKSQRFVVHPRSSRNGAAETFSPQFRSSVIPSQAVSLKGSSLAMWQIPGLTLNYHQEAFRQLGLSTYIAKSACDFHLTFSIIRQVPRLSDVHKTATINHSKSLKPRRHKVMTTRKL